MSPSMSSAQTGRVGRLSLLQGAAEAPHAVAWVLDGHTVSYGELAAALRPVLGGLMAAGIGAERVTPVGVSAELDRESLLLVYALFELGVPVVPLHPRLTPAERSTLLARAGARQLLDPADIHGEPREPPSPRPDDGRPLALLFTSGSSGTPKGVELSRAAFVASAAASAANLGWQEDDRWLLSLPYAHVGGLSVLTRCLIDRRTVVIAPLPRFEPSEAIATVERERVTLMSLVPTQLDRVLAHDPALAPPPTLRALLLGGAPAPASLLRTAAARGWPVLTTYGLTEACSQVATQRPGMPPDTAAGSGPCLPGVEVRLDDGVIALRGPMLLTRYLPAEEYGPPCDGAGWFRTSDLGRLDEQGNLHVIGRADQVILSGGEKIMPRRGRGGAPRPPGGGGGVRLRRPGSGLGAGRGGGRPAGGRSGAGGRGATAASGREPGLLQAAPPPGHPACAPALAQRQGRPPCGDRPLCRPLCARARGVAPFEPGRGLERDGGGGHVRERRPEIQSDASRSARGTAMSGKAAMYRVASRPCCATSRNPSPLGFR